MEKTVLAMALALTCGVASADALKDAPVVFKSGNWSVLRSADSMTDKTECIGIYKQDYSIQLDKEELLIKVRGGPETYQFRVDDEQAGDKHRANEVQRKIDLIQVKDEEFKRLLTAHRLRYNVLTILGHIVEGDLDVTGIAEAVKNISDGCPGEKVSAPIPVGAPASGCSEAARAKLKAKGMSVADVAEICGG